MIEEGMAEGRGRRMGELTRRLFVTIVTLLCMSPPSGAGGRGAPTRPEWLFLVFVSRHTICRLSSLPQTIFSDTLWVPSTRFLRSSTPESYPRMSIAYRRQRTHGRLSIADQTNPRSEVHAIPCLPLYSMLLSLTPVTFRRKQPLCFSRFEFTTSPDTLLNSVLLNPLRQTTC